MVKIRTHYDNLKVTRDAPISVIRAAYKALCQTFHPDKFQGSNEEAERIIKLVNASYAVLIDPVKRNAHNAWIREQEAIAGRQSKSTRFNETEQQDDQEQSTPDEYTQQPPPSSTEDANVIFERAYDLQERGRHEEALSLYRDLAEQGHAKAQFKLGVMYELGQGVAQNYVQAFDWYLKAAEQGEANAQYNVAVKYKTGQGVAQDDTKAAYWYRKAAEQ
ncbi:Sel1 repeat-containing protein [Methylobacter tundripaludum]|uniref:Sel1 repeat-containing protein n=1 Tax=Methylobacter tundripaludum TaxID=173365 RepID=A0A2S6H750_9GAMM|nr:J domain-containing protein [Methylobacter tundripaludum]PPK73319.1 Sel1 repeat-containing protein [Methylobacter tundripaludum]